MPVGRSRYILGIWYPLSVSINVTNVTRSKGLAMTPTVLLMTLPHEGLLEDCPKGAL